MHAEHAQHPTNSLSNPNPKKKKITILLLFLLFNKILEPIDGGHLADPPSPHIIYLRQLCQNPNKNGDSRKWANSEKITVVD
jgi:hypothetical protein